ncbi:MAG: hypothetical protein WCL20_06805 [Actinomycetes bacterium]
MPHHVTPTELGRLVGMERGEVLSTCRKMSIPVLHGRIDKTLFMLNLRDVERSEMASKPPL